MMTHTQTNKFDDTDLKNICRYFEILNAVSSRKLESKNNQADIPVTGFIDKLELEIRLSLTCEKLRRNAKNIGLNCTTTFLNDKKCYIEICVDKEKSAKVYFKRSFDQTSVTRIITNPNNYKNLSHLAETITELIYPQKLSDLKIRRLDLTCDYRIPFCEFKKCVDVSGKQSKVEYKKNEITGIYFGKSPHKILIYDKSIEQNELISRISRIEVQLTSKALPFRNADALSSPADFMAYITASNSFQGVDLFQPTLGDDLSSNELLKSFNTLLNSHGFHDAKQQLNTNKNFNRDIKPYLTKKYFTKQPHQALIEGVRSFCYGD